jgi:hypothetical protein
MKHLRKCPTCGQAHRVTKERLGKRHKCIECGNLYVLSPSAAIAESPPLSVDQSLDRTPRFNLFDPKAWGDPSAALEGAIPGATAGIVSGVIGPFVAGILAGWSPGEILGGALIGFMIGFGVGAVLGGILGARGRRLRPDFRIEPGLPLYLCGAAIGGLTALGSMNWRWIPVGAAIGVAGAILGARVFGQGESSPGERSRTALEDELLGEDAVGSGHRRSLHSTSRYSPE